MAIKLKSSERKQFRSWLRWGLLLLAVCSFAMMMSYDSAVSEMNGSTEEQYEWTEEADQYQSWPNYNSDPEMNLKSFLRYIYAGSYGMYWELQQKIQQRPLQPSELFLSESTRSAGDYEFFDTNFAAWYSVFGSLMEEYEIKYRIKDTKSGTVYTNAVENLEFYEENEGIFFLKLRYDEEESLMIEAMQNADGFVFETREIQGLTKRRFLSWIGVADMHASLLGQPKNVTIYVYSPNPECYVSRTDRGVENLTMMERYRAIQATTGVWYLVLLAVIAVAVWLFLPFRRMRDEEQLYLKRIPVEAAIAGVILILAGYELAVDFCYNYTFNYQGTFQTVRHFGAYFGLFGVWFLSVQVLLQIQVLGIVHFLKERSWILKNLDRIRTAILRTLHRFWDSIRNVDLNDGTDRWLLRIVVLNFLLLSLCCAVWFVGILGLIIYSVLLFFLLRRYLEKVRKNYEALLEVTSQMAQGDLRAEVTGDFGIFTPLGEELAKVKEGFSRAVEEEARSQNMKVELITNVSHDLKTPLTAIITYVNLLKDESVTPEERRSYIDILDRKSMRLKKLIEDLFEVSKAASGTIKLEKRQVDLAEMVRQAVLEQEDRLAEAQIDCRVQTPEGRVLLWLDAEKTYRILENLLVNVSKYALAGTRAWVTLRETENAAEILVKNTSEAELEEDSSYLAERFVRGDKARNTEGSGLGLAIVRSFTELQGGTFAIVTDGDLFKVYVRFPHSAVPAACEEIVTP